MAHLIDDPAGHLLQYFIRDLCALCGHEVDGLHGSQCDGVIIGSLIPHNAYGSHIGQGCEVLVDLAILTCVSDFLAVDGICILYDLDLLGGYFADDTDTQSGTGERLTEYQVLRDTKLQSYLTDLILEQVAQRLDDLLEIYIVGQAAYVVMGLDHCGFTAQSALYHIGIDGSLYEEIHGTDLLRLFLKYTDELFADDLSLMLRLGYTCQFAIETFLRIHTDEMQVIIAIRSEDCLYFIALVLTEQAVIYEDAGQLLTDCLG